MDDYESNDGWREGFIDEAGNLRMTDAFGESYVIELDYSTMVSGAAALETMVEMMRQDPDEVDAEGIRSLLDIYTPEHMAKQEDPARCQQALDEMQSILSHKH